jgi:O-antigen ligase
LEGVNNSKPRFLPIIYVLFASMFMAINITAKATTIVYLGLGILLFIIYNSFLLRLATKKDLKISNGNRNLNSIGVLAVVLITINFISNIYNSGSSYLNIFYLVISILFYLFTTKVVWNSKALSFISSLSVIYLIINLILLLRTGDFESFKGFFNNPNILGAYTGFLLFFPTIKFLESDTRRRKTGWFLTICMMLFLVYCSGSRSVLLALFAAVAVYVVYGIISKNKARYISFFVIILSASLGFLFIYPNLNRYQWFYRVNDFVVSTTGKNIYSGREQIWSAVLEIVKQKPLLGHGAAAEASQFLNISYSSHNLFLNILLQSGWFGLLVFFLILLSIWKVLWTGRHLTRTRLTSAFFVAIIVHQMFEISFTQNNFSIGMVQWLILGVGSSYALNNYKSSIN